MKKSLLGPAVLLVLALALGWWWQERRLHVGQEEPPTPAVEKETSADMASTRTSDAAQVFRDRLQRADVGDYRRLFEELASFKDLALQRALLRELVERWSTQATADLVAYVRGLSPDDTARLVPLLAEGIVEAGAVVPDAVFYPVTEGYASCDLKGAANWAGRVVGGNRDVFPCVEVFGTFAKRSPGEAMDLALSLPENGVRRFVLEHVAFNLDIHDPQTAYARAERLAGKEKSYFYREFFRAWTTAEPENAAKALAALDNPVAVTAGAESVAETLSTRANADMDQVLAWADTLPTPESRGVAVNAIYAAWGMRDPLAASTEAYQRYPENPELAQAMFASALTGRNNDEIWDQARKVPDALQSYALKGVLQPMLQMEPAAHVIARLATLPAGPLRDESSAFVALKWGATSGEARTLAASITDEQLRENVLHQLTQ